jgi:hypothetical protein
MNMLANLTTCTCLHWHLMFVYIYSAEELSKDLILSSSATVIKSKCQERNPMSAQLSHCLHASIAKQRRQYMRLLTE